MSAGETDDMAIMIDVFADAVRKKIRSGQLTATMRTDALLEIVERAIEAEATIRDLRAIVDRRNGMLDIAHKEVTALRDLAWELVDNLHRHETQGDLACDSWCDIDRELQDKAHRVLGEDNRG